MPFFLHVSPMWLTFPLRWRIGQDRNLQEITFCSLFRPGMLRIYLPWCGFYAMFLAVQPWTPVSNMITLYDWNVWGGEPLHRDWPFWQWTLAAWGYCLAHCGMSAYGMIWAALSFRYHPVHVAYSLCIVASIVIRTVLYYLEMYPSGMQQLLMGALELSVASAVTGITALICWTASKTNPSQDDAAAPLTTEQRSDKEV